MENIPDFTKAYSPRKAFKMSRQSYLELLKRVEALEAAVKRDTEQAEDTDAEDTDESGEESRNPTKKELIAIAKEYGITGADRMSKEDISKAIGAANAAKESK